MFGRVGVTIRVVLLVVAILAILAFVQTGPVLGAAQAAPPTVGSLQTTEPTPITPTLLEYVAGIILSALFKYIPGLNTWYDAKTSTEKSLLMLGLVFVAALGIFGLSCSGYFAWTTCDQAGAVGLLTAFVGVLIGNQAAYVVLPQQATKKNNPAQAG